MRTALFSRGVTEENIYRFLLGSYQNLPVPEGSSRFGSSRTSDDQENLRIGEDEDACRGLKILNFLFQSIHEIALRVPTNEDNHLALPQGVIDFKLAKESLKLCC